MAGSILGGSTRDAPGASADRGRQWRTNPCSRQEVTGGRARPGPRPCGHDFHVAERLVERQTFLKSIRRLKRRNRVRAEHGSHYQRFNLWPTTGCPGQSIDDSSHPVNGTLTAFLCRPAKPDVPLDWPKTCGKLTDYRLVPSSLQEWYARGSLPTLGGQLGASRRARGSRGRRGGDYWCRFFFRRKKNRHQ